MIRSRVICNPTLSALRLTCFILVSLSLVSGFSPCRAELRDEALAAARQAANFYWKSVSTEGGYLWRYSADLKLREGEGKVGTTTIWVQPPGTPAVGEAYVRLYDATHDKLFLDAAKAAAEALRRGQLRSGGWNASIEFDPASRKKEAYRLDAPGKNQRNHSSLDDDKTQASLRFLIQLDSALEFKDDPIHEMTLFALDGLCAAQYPSGGFPQVWGEPREGKEFPVLKASFPESWSRDYLGHQNYWHRYTFNDNLMPDVLAALFLSADTYGDKRYEAAALKGADFLLLAQLPEPQPAWAQQYDFEMRPAWARKFEPPAVSGGESQGVLRLLMQVYRRTGDKKYLAPIPPALAYLKKSRLSDGKLARFYELQTNQPLYFTREYVLTYDDSDLPTHYGFKVGSQLDEIERAYQTLLKTPPDQLGGAKETAAKRKQKPSPPSAKLEQQVRRVNESLDSRGAWATDGSLKYHKFSGQIIEMQTAVANLNLLAEYLGK